MSAIEELRAYVIRLQRRFRLGAIARGSAILTVAALLVTVLLTIIINRFAFSTVSLWSARAVLILTLTLGAVFGLAVPLWRLGQRWWTRRAERTFPEFGQRLLTFIERDEKATDPFIELLAADTLRVARTTDLKTAAPDGALVALFAVGALSLGALVWLIRSGPGYLGYGAAALWTGPQAEPLYDVRVNPGDATVRRHTDQLVTAELRGMQREQIKIHVRYQGTSKWEDALMQPRPAAAGFQFLLSGVAQDLEYFVEAGAVVSPHFHLRVADAPTVKQIRVTYHHPDWTQLPDTVDEHGGDLRAVEGTEARLEVITDLPLESGTLTLDDGRQVALSASAPNVYRGAIKLEKDGSYHVATRDRNQALRISDDFYIEASPVKPPEVALVRPERDYRASPIEEVALAAKAADPFGLSEFTLHYSVNGGPDKSIRLMKEPGAHSASGSALIALESLKLVPGDVVGVYAAAKDARGEARTDISFIQVDPFEREFSQSQQSGGGAGGGGGGANDQAQIAEREKEIIAATWKQDGVKTAPAKQAAEQAKFLADVQTTLRGQSFSLAGRLGMRDLQTANEQFNTFQLEMAAAATAMGPAAQKLSDQQWGAAVADEQKALQHLLRAEATFRQIQVAFNSRASGGGGVNSAGRDLASLFDLELDTQKNQYESAQTPFSNSEHASEIEDALKKLDELARRQSELAQRNGTAEPSAEERWQQEMLRRKAEELQQQIEQLARNGGQKGAAGSSGGKSSGESGESGQAAEPGKAPQSNSTSSNARRALNRLRQAQDDMRRAVDEHNPLDARRAADRLRDAMNLLAGAQREGISTQLDALNREAGRLAGTQREQSGRMSDLRSGRGIRRRSPNDPVPGIDGGGGVDNLIQDRQKLADDLARLTQDMRTAERQARERSPSAASKLHDALGDLESSDTETHLQRSADMLRRGYAPLNDDVETQAATDLKRLTEQLGAARTAINDTQGSSDDALDSVDRLRSRLAALDRNLHDDGEGQQRSTDPLARGQPGSPGDGRPGSQQGGAQADARGGGQGDSGGDQSNGAQVGGRTGDVGGNRGALAGPVGGAAGGAYNGGAIDGGWNSGNNSALPRPVGPNRTVIGPESRQVYQEGINELGRLRRAVGKDPESLRQVDALIRSIQRLDPKRFPGNPAMVDELYSRVLSGVDKLELQLRHEPVDAPPGEVRSDNPPAIPTEYQAAVAEYFRRLSKNP